MRDVTEQAFRTEVIEASRVRPVVVDFWADWCRPCHQLSPLLEQAAAKYADDVDVVKVDIDQAPNLARALGIKGIPAVKAFAGGRIVSEFTGVQPPAAIDAFFAALATSKADKLVAQAGYHTDDAESLYRQALELEPGHPGASVGLAGILVERDERDEAREVLERATPSADVERMLATIRLSQDAGDDLDVLRKRLADEAGVVIELARALAARGDHDEAIALLLGAVGDPDLREDARRLLVEVFTVLGDDDPRVRSARPRLAAALY